MITCANFLWQVGCTYPSDNRESLDLLNYAFLFKEKNPKLF